MAWPDKFDALEQKIRDENMTFTQLGDYLNKEYDLVLIVSPAQGVPPFHAGGGAISPERFTSRQIKDKLSDAPQEMKDKILDKFAFEVGIGPGPEPNTPVAEVTGFIHVLKHELSHLQMGKHTPQDKLNRMQKGYISPHEDGATLADVAMYILQPIERPAQATDYASHLARIGMTVDGFEGAINAVYKFLKTQDGINSERLMDLASSEMVHHFGSMNKMVVKSGAEGMDMDISQVTSTIAALALVKMAGTVSSKDLRNKVKSQYRAFMKLLRKRYPKVKAYQLKHKGQRQDAYNKNIDERANMTRMVQELMSALDVFMGDRAG